MTEYCILGAYFLRVLSVYIQPSKKCCECRDTVYVSRRQTPGVITSAQFLFDEALKYV